MSLAQKFWQESLNPDYALDILLIAKTPSKFEALQLLLIHHSGDYASLAKVQILLGFWLSLQISNA